jgi:D-amino-acid oxidase
MAAASVLVIGAGVSGLSTAIRLLEAGADVLVRTAAPPLGTTSAVAGAMIGPVLADPADPADPAAAWLTESDAVFRGLTADPRTGVAMRTGRLLSAPALGRAVPAGAADVPGFRALTAADLPDGFSAGFRAELPMVDMPVYLGWLTDRVAALGGRIELAPVLDLDRATATADVVVNCAGSAAGELAGDVEMTPVRGQHVLVDAPSLTDFVYELGGSGPAGPGEWVGVMPHGRRVVLGGVAQYGSTSLVPDPAVTAGILRRCTAAVPELRGAPVIGVEVGIRPRRTSARVEREGEVVHNYGHGGNGVMLSWGCAAAAARLAGVGGRLG